MKKNILSVLLLAGCLYQQPAASQMLADSGNKKNRVQPESKNTVLLQQALAELESHFQVTIAYKSNLADQLVTYPQQTQFLTIEAALAFLLPPYNLKYKKLQEGVYVIASSREAEDETNGVPASNLPAGAGINTADTGLLSGNLPANPEGVITGQVTDSKGESLPGVNIRVKNTATGTITDAQGKYSLPVPDGDIILVFTYIGYTNKEITVNGSNVLNITLQEEASALNEVIVVGYGAVKKSSLTGAVASVKGDDLPKAAMPNMSSMLQGRVAGLNIIQSSAKPGGAFDYSIRGLCCKS